MINLEMFMLGRLNHCLGSMVRKRFIDFKVQNIKIIEIHVVYGAFSFEPNITECVLIPSSSINILPSTIAEMEGGMKTGLSTV